LFSPPQPETYDEELNSIEFDLTPRIISEQEYEEETASNRYMIQSNNDDIEDDISTVDKEVDTNIIDINKCQFKNQLKSNDLDQTNLVELAENHMPLKTFKINPGSDEIPLFLCANHKLNLVIRGAIAIHQELTQILKDVNKSNSSVRRSVKLNRAFKNEKCKLRLENVTRWSSSYLMLLSV